MEIPVTVMKPVTEVIVEEKRQRQPMWVNEECNLFNTQRPTEVCYVKQQPRNTTEVIYKNTPTQFFCHQQPKLTVVEEQKQVVIPELEQYETNVFNRNFNTFRMNPTEVYYNELPQTYFDEQKHWFVKVDLQKEMFVNTPIRRNNVLIKVKTNERVLKIRVEQNLRRMIRLPENIEFNKIRVHLLKDIPKLIIVAPWTLENRYEKQQMIENELELLTEERLMETEPMMYQLVQKMRQQLPKFIKLAGVRRCRTTGEFKLGLDLIKTGVRVEEINVMLKDLERTLVIRAELEQLKKEEELKQLFQVRRFHHEIQLPTFVDAKRVQIIKLNTNTMRLELPIVGQTELFNTLCNKVEKIRMF